MSLIETANIEKFVKFLQGDLEKYQGDVRKLLSKTNDATYMDTGRFLYESECMLLLIGFTAGVGAEQRILGKEK